MKVRKGKKITAIVLAVLMVVGLMPTDWIVGTAKAAGEEVYVLTANDAEVNQAVSEAGNDAALTKAYDVGTNGFFTLNKNVKINSGRKDSYGGTTYANRIKTEGKPGKADEKSIAFTVPTGKVATLEIYACSGNSSNRTDVAVMKDGSVVKKSDPITNKNADLITLTDIEAGSYYICCSGTKYDTDAKTTNIYYIKATLTSADGPTGTAPVVGTVTAAVNAEDASKVDIKWTATTEGTGDGKYVVAVSKDGGAEEVVKTVSADTKELQVQPDATGSYVYKVYGVLGSAKTAAVSATAVDYVLQLSAPVVKLTKGDTTVDVSWDAVNEATKYVVICYKEDGTTQVSSKEIVVAENVELKAQFTELTQGAKYGFVVKAIRGTSESASEISYIRPYKDVDASNAIPGLKNTSFDKGTLTIMRDAGKISVFMSSGNSAKVESSGIKDSSYIYSDATTSNFTFTAKVKVEGNERGSSAGNQHGVFLGVVDKVDGSTAMFGAVELGGDGKIHYAGIGVKESDPAKINRNDGAGYSLNKVYTLSMTREGNKYTVSVKDSSGKEVYTYTDDNAKLTAETPLYPMIALVGATAELSDIKLTVDGTDKFDSTKLTDSFAPFIDNWAIADTPVLTDVTTAENKKNGEIAIEVDSEIGAAGASSIEVTMYNEAGEKLSTSTISAMGTQKNTVKFTPDASGKYKFKAVAKRVGEETTKTSEELTVSGFMFPVAAPNLRARTGSNHEIIISWDAVKEATSYKVEYKKATDSEYKTLVESTNETSVSTEKNLTVGDKYTFKVTAIRSIDNANNCKEYTHIVTEEEQFDWKFSAFGQGVTSKEEDAGHKVNSEDGSVQVWNLNNKGKLVQASTDGLSYYYTSVPSNMNFTLTATAKVNKWTYTNGQEGFGLMAADRVGEHGNSSVFWNNSYMASVTKVEYYADEEGNVASSGNKITMKLGIGSQEKIGVTKDNLSKLQDGDLTPFSSKMTTLDKSCSNKESGTYNIIANATNTIVEFTDTNVENLIDTVKLKIQKNNTGYFVSYIDAEGNETTRKYYDTAALSKIDEENVYVGMFASRACDVTFSDINLVVTDPATDAPAEERPIEYIDPSYKVKSSTVTNNESYKFEFVANADGHVEIKMGNTVVADTDVKADEKIKFDTKLSLGKNKFKVTMVPDSDYKPSEFERLSSYETKSFDFTVTYNYFKGDIVYVSPNGSSKGNGTKEKPTDIYTATKFAAPGQKVLIMEGTYNLESTVTVQPAVCGTADNMIYLMADPDAKTRPVFDFGKKSAGFIFAGDYWYIQGFDVTNTANGQKGIQVSGDNNTLDGIMTYKNGNTGVQISRYLDFDKEDWPKNNLILNCTSFDNADAGYEDADGFAAKLTIGEGNVFDGCMAYNNADDGWDLFAKPESGPIGAVVIKNCVAFANGYLSDGTMAGNGNGFKMGGTSITGKHQLINCAAWDNKAKGIDSNSGPDIIVKNCVSFNNGAANVALYTNDAKNTEFVANGVISFRTKYLGVGEIFKLKGTQDKTKVYNSSNYFWNCAEDGCNNSASVVGENWFVSLDNKAVAKDEATPAAVAYSTRAVETFVPVVYSTLPISRNANGSINMNGFLELTETAVQIVGAENAFKMGGTPSIAAKDVITADDVVTTGPVVATGDSTNVALYVIFALLSVLALAGVVVFEKKRRA